MESVTLLSVNYNSTNKLNKLLKSVQKYLYPLINEIIIIDNNSTDIKDLIISKKLKAKTTCIINKKNIGFSKAVNYGLKASKNKYILLVNPDSCFFDNSIINAINLLKNNPKIGVVGGKIYGLDKKTRFSATNKPSFLTTIFEFTVLKKIFSNNIFSKKFWIESNNKVTKPIKVHSVCGAFMLIRKDINKIFFDTNYFLYLEDLDFGSIVEQNDYETYFDPRSQIIHIGGYSSHNNYGIIHKYWYTSRDYYFRKHFKGILGQILKYIFIIETKLLIIFKIGDLHNTINEK